VVVKVATTKKQITFKLKLQLFDEINRIKKQLKIKSKSILIDIILNDFNSKSTLLKHKIIKDLYEITKEENFINFISAYLNHSTYNNIKSFRTYIKKKVSRIYLTNTMIINIAIYDFCKLSIEEQKKIIDEFEHKRREKRKQLNL
jgi:hypothetical protein